VKKFVTFLTIFRIIASPVIFISLLYLELKLFTLVIFIIAALTDFLDGYLARLFNVESKIGEILDPIADKILLVSTLISITLYFQSSFIGLISILLISREFWVSALRIGASSSKKSENLSVTYLAKLKTASQFASLTLYFFSIQQNFALGILLADFVLFLSLLISIKTGMDYTKKFFQSRQTAKHIY
jgi:CDP-diacylglycerol--glycerol-3-phosphate 3-phosphatidyltransferase